MLEGEGWTASAPLPGGDFPREGAGDLLTSISERYPFLTPAWALRLARAYGTLVMDLLGNAETLDDCGIHFGHGLTETEVRYLMTREWARSAEDILWRRTKLGLRFSAAEQDQLRAFIAAQQAT